MEASSSKLRLESADPLRVDLNLPSGGNNSKQIANKAVIPSVQRGSHAEPGGAQTGAPLTPQVIIYKPKLNDTNKVTLKVQVKLQVLPGRPVNSTGGSRGDALTITSRRLKLKYQSVEFTLNTKVSSVNIFVLLNAGDLRQIWGLLMRTFSCVHSQQQRVACKRVSAELFTEST